MRLRLAAVLVFVGGGFVQGQSSTQAPPPGAYRPGSGVTDPVVVREVKPVYTDAAMRARIQGLVELEAIVRPDGTIANARITKSLDRQYGLDQQAIEAAGGWLFKPGYLDGKPVPVVVTLILEFRLRQDGQPLAAVVTPGGMQAPATAPDATFLKGVALQGAPGVIAPRVRTERKPNYTAEAMRQKIQGVVEVQAVVMPDGSVARARVIKPLDRYYGLDDEALKAVHAWTFEPNTGTVDGQPAAVAVTLRLEFRLH